MAAYLVEQAIKTDLRKLNPLLYFDRRDLSDENEIAVIRGAMSAEKARGIKTINARKCVSLLCEYRPTFRKHRSALGELFLVRNHLLHSTDDLPDGVESAAEVAVSVLQAFDVYIAKCAGSSIAKVNPLTSKRFAKLQEIQRETRILSVKDRIEVHRLRAEKLTPQEIQERINTNKPPTKTSDEWIESTLECPACSEEAMDQIGYVDWDTGDEGEPAPTAGYSFECRVCELELSEYEMHLATGWTPQDYDPDQ